MLGIQQPVALQPVAGDLGHHPQPGRNGKLQARRAGNGAAHSRSLITNADSTQDVVAKQGNEEGEHEQDGQGVNHHLQHRQAEGIKAQVVVELGVLYAKVLAIEE